MLVIQQRQPLIFRQTEASADESVNCRLDLPDCMTPSILPLARLLPEAEKSRLSSTTGKLVFPLRSQLLRLISYEAPNGFTKYLI